MANKDTISLELTKVVNHKDLKPFGKFTIKWKTRQGHLHNIIPFNELQFQYDAAMPLTDEQDKAVVKFMLKNKTDILWDGRHTGFYTRAGDGFVCVYHEKLAKYRDEAEFRALFND